MKQYKAFYGSGYTKGKAETKKFTESDISKDNGFSKKDIRDIKRLDVAQCKDLSDISIACIVRIK